MDLTQWLDHKCQLKPRQVNDLLRIYQKTIDENKLSTFKKASKFFEKGTLTWANFFLRLEKETKWFDFTQAVDVEEELRLYLEHLR